MVTRFRELLLYLYLYFNYANYYFHDNETEKYTSSFNRNTFKQYSSIIVSFYIFLPSH